MTEEGTVLKIKGLDHFVLTVASVEATCRFYQDVLGMTVSTISGGRRALHFGNQKINLHEVGKEFEPKAARPTAGSGDICLIAETPVAAVATELEEKGIAIEVGPVPRTGAVGELESVYIRDPDGNLVEISNYRK